MPRSRLRKETRQSKPFASPEIEVHLNILRTEDRIIGDFSRFLKQHGISQPQYNVLRILRGAGPQGLPSLGVAERMVARVPDVTRVLDRMAKKGWLRRVRSKLDGRIVLAHITPKGRRLLERLDEPVVAFTRAQLGHMSRKDLAALNHLLEKARSADA